MFFVTLKAHLSNTLSTYWYWNFELRHTLNIEAIVKGLKLAHKLKPTELDSKEAYEVLAIYCLASHPYADIIGEISNLASQNWFVTFHHVVREANFCAVRLAKHGHGIYNFVFCRDDVPNFLGCLLRNNVTGVPSTPLDFCSLWA